IECNRYAGHTAIGVEMGNAELVLWVGAGRPARTFGEDDDLTAFGERLAGMRRHVRQRGLAGAAVDRDHAAMPSVPTEEGNPHKLAVDDEGRVGKQRDQCKRLPYRLMLGGNHDAAGWDFFEPAPFNVDATHDA